VLIGLRKTALVLSAALLAGCAARSPRVAPAPSASAYESGVSSGLTAEALSEFMAKVRHLSTAARPNAKGKAQSLEDSDPELAADLRRLASAPSADLECRVAEHYRQRGVLDTAYEHFNRALALNSRDAGAYEGLARVWRDWGFPKLGLGDAHRATFFAPQSATAQNTYGTLMQSIGRYREARMAYELASWLDPTAAYAVNNLCYLAFLEGRTDAAIKSCSAAIKLDPSLAAARNNLALALAASGRMDLARAQFMAGADRASGLYNTGIAYLAAGDRPAALAAFDEASRARASFAVARERANQLRRLLPPQPASVTERLDGALQR
jgi:tetratricopeptide (TPR) repeat protein